MVEVDPFRDPSFYHLEPIKCGTQFRRILRQADLFAQPITMRYKKEKMFYTNFGAVASLCIIMIMVLALSFEVVTIAAKSKVTIATNNILSINKDPEL